MLSCICGMWADYLLKKTNNGVQLICQTQPEKQKPFIPAMKTWSETRKCIPNGSFKMQRSTLRNLLFKYKKSLEQPNRNKIMPEIRNLIKQTNTILTSFFKLKNLLIIYSFNICSRLFRFDGQQMVLYKKRSYGLSQGVLRQSTCQTQITIDCEKIDINEQWKKLADRYGDTNFFGAFKALKVQIQKTSIHQLSRILVLFYTDCQHNEVSYPKDELLQLALLPQKRQTTFIACTNEELSPVLSQIIDFLKQHFSMLN